MRHPPKGAATAPPDDIEADQKDVLRFEGNERALMNDAALRQARYRERARDGKVVLPIEVDLNGLSAALIAGDFLAERDCDDREAIARATERALQVLIRLSASDA